MGTVSFFVPHVGCPVKCSFCNQHSISGSNNVITAEQVVTGLERIAKKINDNCAETQIAFFGGSFTAIDKNQQESLLDAAKYAVENYGYKGIRFSTRPDAIDENIIDRLKNYPIIAVELGAQSMDDKVLLANHRGHTAQDTIEASKLIKQVGYELTLQMMVGLHKDTLEGAKDTALKIVEIKPESTRIYPTIVLKGTQLEELYHEGKYTPIGLEETIECCGELLEIFRIGGVKVIKLGLHQEESMVNSMVAGPHHPALRELCEGHLLEKQIKTTLLKKNIKNAKVYVCTKDYSKIAGHKGYFKNKFSNDGYKLEFLQDKTLKKDQVLII